MVKLLVVALLISAGQPPMENPPAGRPEAQGSAGPWMACLTAVGRQHRARRASVNEFMEAVEEHCAEASEWVRAALPRVFELSLQEARSTYSYCLQPDKDDNPRCRSLR